MACCGLYQLSHRKLQDICLVSAVNAVYFACAFIKEHHIIFTLSGFQLFHSLTCRAQLLSMFAFACSDKCIAAKWHALFNLIFFFKYQTVYIAVHLTALHMLSRCVQVCGRGSENIREPQPEEEEHGRRHTVGYHRQQCRTYRKRCRY